MANDKKFIVKNGLRADNIEFTDSQSGSNQITLSMLNTDTLNFEGDAGSLFSIADDLTGSVFTVGDISGIPIVDVNGDTHNITMAQFDGKVMIGGTDSGSTDSDVLNVTGNVKATTFIGPLTGNATTASTLETARNIGGVSFNGSESINLPGVNTSGSQNTSGTAAIATTVTVADESTDTTCFPLFATAATGDLAPKSGTNLTFNSSSGLLTATTFSGSAASLSQIPMAEASGTLAAARVGELPASKITSGTFDSARLPDLATSDITSGTLDSARLPVIASTNTAITSTNVTVADESTDTTCFPLFVTAATGDLAPKSGTNLQFNSSSGVLQATSFDGDGSALANLNATKLASGTVSSARLSLSASDIPNLATSKITSGVFDSARIPVTGDITAAKITSGIIDSARLPAGTFGGGGGGTADAIAADNIQVGDAAINLTTNTGNITIDAQGNDTDIIFKGTDNNVDRTFLTIDGSEAGKATFLSEIVSTGLQASGDTFVDSAGGFLFDVSDKALEFGDNYKAIFGAGSDLKIYHDGDTSIIHDNGTGALLVRTNNFKVNNAGNSEKILHGVENGAVELYHNNSLKLETTSDGATVTGNLSITNTANNGPTLSLISDDPSDATDFGTEGHIKFFAENDASQSVEYANIEMVTRDVSDGSEDGRLEININEGGTVTRSFIFDHDNFYITNAQQIHWLNFTSTHEYTLKPTTISETRNVLLPDASGTIALTSDIASAGISSGNVATFTSGVVDNDFLRVDGTAIEGRSASEVLSDIAAMPLAGGTFSGDVSFDSAGGFLFDVSDQALEFGDNYEAVFGAGTDLRIFHDGSNSNIINTTGSLIIADTSGDVKIQGKYGEQSIIANNDGSVELYHDNSKKFETASGGVSITGTATATTFSGSGASLTNLPAGQLTGTIDSARLPDLATSDITSGVLDSARVPIKAIGAGNITSGTIASARLSLGADDIPNLAASKITSGTLDSARLPVIASANSANSASSATVAAAVTASTTATNATHYVTFIDGQTGSQVIENDAGLTYNPSSNTLTTTTFSGALSGNATTATELAVAVNIGGVLFDGSSSIDLPGVNSSGNQNTSGTAAIATSITAVANNSANETVYLTFVDGATGTQGIETDTGLTYNPSTGLVTATKFSGDGSSLTGIAAGAADGIFLEYQKKIVSSYNVDAGVTALTACNDSDGIEITSGVTVTISDSSGWVITGGDKNMGLDAMVATSNQTERTMRTGTIKPTLNNTYDLGDSAVAWRNIYTNDLNLSNETGGGNDVDGTTGKWTIQEGEENLYIINRKTGKKYKFMLEEIV